jgi:hypothetical protein
MFNEELAFTVPTLAESDDFRTTIIFAVLVPELVLADIVDIPSPTETNSLEAVPFLTTPLLGEIPHEVAAGAEVNFVVFPLPINTVISGVTFTLVAVVITGVPEFKVK